MSSLPLSSLHSPLLAVSQDPQGIDHGVCRHGPAAQAFDGHPFYRPLLVENDKLLSGGIAGHEVVARIGIPHPLHDRIKLDNLVAANPSHERMAINRSQPASGINHLWNWSQRRKHRKYNRWRLILTHGSWMRTVVNRPRSKVISACLCLGDRGWPIFIHTCFLITPIIPFNIWLRSPLMWWADIDMNPTIKA